MRASLSLSLLPMYARFAFGLPSHLRRRITLDEARAIVADRLAHREENFLRLVDRAIWARPASPYRWLLARAGVEADDLRAMVARDGLEPALRALREAGAYVTFEEFKGSVPIVRDGRVLRQRAVDFGNPLLAASHEMESGGSTGTPRRVTTDLTDLFAQAPALMLFDDAHGFHGLPSAVWMGPLPESGLNGILSRISSGQVPERWFTPLGDEYRPALRFRLANRAALAIASSVGVRIPGPEHVPVDQAIRVALWAAEARDRAGASLLRTTVSRAVRVAVAARAAGLDMTGVAMTAGGEPPTETKAREILASGARLATNYFFTEVGAVGLGCARPADPNDQHFLADHLAVIAHRRGIPGFDRAVDAFHFTTLLPTARSILLNVESDDYGWIERRPCGCSLEKAGYEVHLRGIRSFRKLTGEGVTLVGSEMEKILEEVLPGRFGGTPLDYQFAEEEDGRGLTRLVLRASPWIPIESERELAAAVLDTLRKGTEASRQAAAVLLNAGTLEVRRAEPRWTRGGKLLPLDSDRRAPRSAGGPP